MDDVERISTSDRKQQQNFMILPFAIESRSMLEKKHNVMRMEALSLRMTVKMGLSLDIGTGR
jgi:hypothetical protein